MNAGQAGGWGGSACVKSHGWVGGSQRFNKRYFSTIKSRSPSVKIEDAPLNVELPAEQRRAPPPVLRDAAFYTNVEAHSIPAAVARTMPDLAIAASTNEVQGAGTEEILVVVASLLVREVRTGGRNRQRDVGQIVR